MNSDHLSYPSTSTSPLFEGKDKELRKERIFVGNLGSTIDEFALLQLFSKFGPISKLDFLFHRNGPLKGKPRGYAFVEFSNADDATRAIAAAHEKPLRGRNLIVTYANQAPTDPSSHGSVVRRRTLMESGRPTALSLMKEKTKKRLADRTEDKIAIMEAKLRQMEASSSSCPISLPDSLPKKPRFSVPLSEENPPRRASKSAHPGLPRVHVVPPATPMPVTPKATEKKKLLTGVRIVKRKVNEVDS